MLTYYQADEKEPWSYLWVGFGGKNARQYLSDLGLGESRMMFQSDSGEELKQIVMEMLQHRQSSILTDFKLESLLYAFFSVLAKTAVVPKQKYRELEISTCAVRWNLYRIIIRGRLRFRMWPTMWELPEATSTRFL